MWSKKGFPVSMRAGSEPGHDLHLDPGLLRLSDQLDGHGNSFATAAGVDLPRVERHADDGPGDPRAGQLAQLVHRGDAAGGVQRVTGRLHQLGHERRGRSRPPAPSLCTAVTSTPPSGSGSTPATSAPTSWVSGPGPAAASPPDGPRTSARDHQLAGKLEGHLLAATADPRGPAFPRSPGGAPRSSSRWIELLVTHPAAHLDLEARGLRGSRRWTAALEPVPSAASRSTTWSAWKPAVFQRLRHVDRVRRRGSSPRRASRPPAGRRHRRAGRSPERPSCADLLEHRGQETPDPVHRSSRVELHADHAPGPNHRREPDVLRAPSWPGPRRGFTGAADEAVRVVGRPEARTGQEGVLSLDPVPSDVRDAGGVEPAPPGREDPQPCPGPLLARLEQELHPQADAQARRPPRGAAPGPPPAPPRGARRGRRKAPTPGKDQQRRRRGRPPGGISRRGSPPAVASALRSEWRFPTRVSRTATLTASTSPQRREQPLHAVPRPDADRGGRRRCRGAPGAPAP